MHTKRGLLATVIFGLVVLTAGCGGNTVSTTSSSETSSTLAQSTTTTAAGGGLVFTATLKGSNEVPAVKTSATGTITLTVEPDGSTVDYVITLKKLSNVTVARLRSGKPGGTSSAITTLFDGPTKTGVFSGELASGSITDADLGGPLKGKTVSDLVNLIKSGKVYLNVGTTSHKSGAICGTLTPTATVSTATTSAALTTTTSQANGGQSSAGAQALADLFNKYKKATTVSLDFAVTTADGQSTAGKMWSDAGKKLKIETTVQGVVSVMIIDLAQNTMIVYQPSTKQGMKTTVNLPVQDPSSYADNVDIGNVQDLGTEDIDGETCRVLQYTAKTGTDTGSTIKMWLSERLGFPLKVQATGSDGKVTTIQYSNIKVGSLPGDTFTVPAGVKITTTP